MVSVSNRVNPGATAVQYSGLATPAADDFLAELTSGLPARIRHRVAAFDRVDSTNRIAREIAMLPEFPADVVIADLQSAGRGRLGRGWYSERGNSLVSSFVVALLEDPLKNPLEDPSGDALEDPSGEGASGVLLPVASAVATAEAVESVLASPLGSAAASAAASDAVSTGGLPTIGIKWPNDLIARGAKLSGILIESVRPGVFVVGIGVNVGRMLFPVDIAPRAVSLSTIAGRDVSRMRLLSSLIQRMDERCADLATREGRRALLAAYRGRLIGVGNNVELKRTADSAVVHGRMEGIEDDGALVLRTEAGRQTFHAGDITSGVFPTAIPPTENDDRRYEK